MTKVTFAVNGRNAFDTCALEIASSWKSCAADKLGQNDARCMKCVSQHRRAINSKMIPGTRCTAPKLAGYCGMHTSYTVQAADGASDSCALEIASSWKSCARDSLQHQTAQCMKCVAEHRHAIDAGLIPGTRCDRKKLTRYCSGGGSAPQSSGGGGGGGSSGGSSSSSGGSSSSSGGSSASQSAGVSGFKAYQAKQCNSMLTKALQMDANACSSQTVLLNAVPCDATQVSLFCKLRNIHAPRKTTLDDDDDESDDV
jgi:hypothetical protein